MDLLNVFSGSDRARRIAQGDVLFREGDPGDVMYVVLDGRISVDVGGRNIDSVSEGGIVGEMAMIDDRPRSATAVAATECRIVPIEPTWFKHLIRKNPDFAIHVMSVVSDRLRRQVALSAASSGDERV